MMPANEERDHFQVIREVIDPCQHSVLLLVILHSLVRSYLAEVAEEPRHAVIHFVAGILPEAHRPGVVVQYQGGYTLGSLGGEAPFDFGDENSGNSLPAAGWMDGQAINVAAPAVETADHGAGDPSVP